MNSSLGGDNFVGIIAKDIQDAYLNKIKELFDRWLKAGGMIPNK